MSSMIESFFKKENCESSKMKDIKDTGFTSLKPPPKLPYFKIDHTFPILPCLFVLMKDLAELHKDPLTQNAPHFCT